MGRLLAVLKRFLVGRPVSYHAELHHRVSKKSALAVFSSDALSSSAYATDVMLVALAIAGSAALGKSIPITIAVCAVLMVVVIWWQNLLHGQTALLIKTALLVEPNVFVIDVPFRIGTKEKAKVPS